MVSSIDTQLRGASFLTNGLLGIGQILVWGGSIFLLAVLADPIRQDTHWPVELLYGGLSFGILVSGLLAPWAGRQIAAGHGKTLLRWSGVVMGTGLLILGFSTSLATFGLGWGIIGVGMAMGHFEALFAVLGQQQGSGAKQAISQVTLVSGFCTTLIWPLLAWGVSQWGWRTTCISYGILLGGLVWLLYQVALPDSFAVGLERTDQVKPKPVAHSASVDPLLFWLLALNFTLAAIIMTALSVQLISVLQAKGISLAEAVAIGAVIGPCQVGIRLVDTLIHPKHPIWTTFISTILTGVGLILFGLPTWFALPGVVLYSLGNGMRSILRGTLPLALVSQSAYPLVMGRLARPAKLAQAITPLAGGYLVQQGGPLALVVALTGLALINIGITFAIKWRMERTPNVLRPNVIDLV